MLRPTSPGATSRELGEALTLGVSWGGCLQNSCVPCFSATGSDPINPWPLLFLVKLDVSVSCLPPSLVLGRMPSEDRPHPFPVLGWESGLQDSLPPDSQHPRSQALAYLSFPLRHKEMALAFPLA